MAKRKLFMVLATAAGYIGIGLLLGYAFSDRTRNTALWIGILLVLLGAVLLGMFISSREERVHGNESASEHHSEPTELA